MQDQELLQQIMREGQRVAKIGLSLSNCVCAVQCPSNVKQSRWRRLLLRIVLAVS